MGVDGSFRSPEYPWVWGRWWVGGWVECLGGLRSKGLGPDNDQCHPHRVCRMQIDEYGKLFSQLIRLKKSKSSCEIRTQWTWEVPRRVSPSQSTSLRLWVYHLLTSFTKTIYSSNSEEVQLLTMEPLPIFDLDGMDTTLISSPQIYFSPEQSSLHLAAEVVRALDSGMMVPVQVGNNEDDWCDIIGRTGPTLTTPSERSPPLSWTLTLLLFHGTEITNLPCKIIREARLFSKHGVE